MSVNGDAAPGRSIAIVGAGPRGTGLLERLCANVPALFPDESLAIHMIDPCPFGAGRIWRHDVSPLLKMNSMAEDVTMFTDDSVVIEGPIVPGPTLDEWAACAPSGNHRPPSLDAEIHGMSGRSFPTRLVQSEYLAWTFRRSVSNTPDNVTVHLHPHRALDLRDTSDGRQVVALDGPGGVVLADVVVLALGHLSARPGPAEARLAAFAEDHGLLYFPPGHTADLDLSGIRAGEDVIVRGMGLAAIDLTVLLTEGRGGSFVPRQAGGLDYRPSGREPVLHLGSRRGVPYHSKITYRLVGQAPTLPRYLDRAAVRRVLDTGRPVSLRRDLWPLIAKDIAFAYYHELFTAHPARTTSGWDRFAERFTQVGWDTEPMRTLVAETVPDPADRLDLDALDRPLRGVRFDGAEALQAHVRDYVERDLRRAHDPRWSPAVGIFNALLSSVMQVLPVLAGGRMTARGRTVEFGEFYSLFSYLASGPPPHRLEELLALSRAGVVRFLGADMCVRTEAGAFVAGSPSVDGTGTNGTGVDGTGTNGTVRARVLVDARIARPSLARTTDPLLGALHARGEVDEETLRDDDGCEINTGLVRVAGADGRLLDAAGRPHPSRFALGVHTNGFSVGAFSRPRTNAPFFRQNDGVARRILTVLRRADSSEAPASPA